MASGAIVVILGITLTFLPQVLQCFTSGCYRPWNEPYRSP